MIYSVKSKTNICFLLYLKLVIILSVRAVRMTTIAKSECFKLTLTTRRPSYPHGNPVYPQGNLVASKDSFDK